MSLHQPPINCFILISPQLTDTAVTLTDPMTTLSPSQTIASTAAEILEPIKEVPFTELGLGGWTPVGLLQHLLEGLHIGLDLPWWGAIAVGKHPVVRVVLL